MLLELSGIRDMYAGLRKQKYGGKLVEKILFRRSCWEHDLVQTFTGENSGL
jgi:hypothetical protein